ncbi:hypothetical protein D3C73_1213370 [compost metagenome]
MVAGRLPGTGQRHRRVLLPARHGHPVPDRTEPASPRCPAALGTTRRRRDAAGHRGTGVLPRPVPTAIADPGSAGGTGGVIA